MENYNLNTSKKSLGGGINELQENKLTAFRINLNAYDVTVGDSVTSGNNIELWNDYNIVYDTPQSDEQVVFVIDGKWFVNSLGGLYISTQIKTYFIYNDKFYSLQILNTGDWTVTPL